MTSFDRTVYVHLEETPFGLKKVSELLLPWESVFSTDPFPLLVYTEGRSPEEGGGFEEERKENRNLME